MEKQTVNGISPNMNGNSKRPPSYSVETPYGFHLDLDFLKYVDDIEKGNTLKRVPMQRRTRPASASAHHNHSLPGHGRTHGPTQWSSIGSLWPKARGADGQHTYDGVPSGYPRHPGAPCTSPTSAHMEESIRAFDEQPLGCYVRPNLLRASSLPATVLQRKRSESNDDPTSPRGSRGHLLLQEDDGGSSEDVFVDSGRMSAPVGGAGAGTLQRLTAALRRVGELEEEIRVVPELRAQICILQEEKERLLTRLYSDPESSPEVPNSGPKANGRLRASQAGGKADWGNGHSSGRGSSSLEDQEEDWMSRELQRLEEKVKASSVQVETEAMMSSVRDGTLSGAGQRSARSVPSKERAEHQSVDALQKRLASLEQRLRESEKELEMAKTMLQTHVEDGRLKDQRIEELRKMERAEAQQDASRNLNTTISSSCSVTQQGMPSKKDASEITPEEWRVAGDGGSRQEGTEPAHVSHHVGRVRQLLQEQWECLCAGQRPAEPLPPRVSSIQEELVRLVDTLASCVDPGQRSGPGHQLTEAKTSALGGEYCLVEETIRSGGANHSRPSGCEEIVKEDSSHRDEANPHRRTEREQDIQTQPGSRRQTTGSATQQERTEDMSGHQGGSRESVESGNEANRVDEAFIAACLYLRDHMDEMANLNDDMRQALTVVFQQWFHVTAEEDSSVHTVALYLDKVRAAAPSLLHFLVNLADDNGNTALHYSVSHSNFAIVQTLLSTGVCDVDVRNKAGYTSIMLASLTAADSALDLEVVRQLLRSGDASVRAGQAGQTALHLAARHGRRLIVPLLLAAGADANAQDRSGSTALMLTCERGHGDIVAFLLEQANCDLTLTDREGRCALSIALQASFTDIADLLKAHMAS
ncbi:KN motif and ankyrin repeat domain-containing protein 3-like isoform X1 [Alosa pseudoharengus]|uniref:KN motif and ankyrin repeat domain-containing protein 3-like isoform X1 n=1 Tax=Alosa pseudoharengus TaxID=34774 RepID=UPI003F8C117E